LFWFWFRFAFDVLGPFAFLVLVVEVLAVSADAGVRTLGGAGDVSAAVIRDNTSGVRDQLFGTVDLRALGPDANVSGAFGNAVCAFGFDSARNHGAIKLRAPAVLLHTECFLGALNVGIEAVGVANDDDSSGVGNIQRHLFGSTGVQRWRHSSCWQDGAVGCGALLSGAFDLGAIDVEAEGLVLDFVVLVSFEGVVFVTLGNVTVLRERKSDGVSPAFFAIGRRGRGRTGNRWFFVEFNAYVVLFGLDGSKTCDEDAEDKQLHFVVLAS